MRLLEVSNRFVIGVILALLLAGAFYANFAPENPLPGHRENADYSEYRPGGARCDPLKLRGLTGGKAEIERSRCADSAEEYRLKNEDLLQQTRAAEAAEAMAKLTYSQSLMMAAGTSIGFLTLIAAFFAVLYARKAGTEAQRAATAAEGQLQQAAKISAAEMRPYLFVDVVEIEDSGDAIIPLRITMKTSERSPRA